MFKIKNVFLAIITSVSFMLMSFSNSNTTSTTSVGILGQSNMVKVEVNGLPSNEDVAIAAAGLRYAVAYSKAAWQGSSRNVASFIGQFFGVNSAPDMNTSNIKELQDVYMSNLD
jgi:hypothetical protein